MNIYSVVHIYDTLDVDQEYVLGVFSDYIKARGFELRWLANNPIEDWQRTKIMKLEIDKEYPHYAVGEEV